MGIAQRLVSRAGGGWYKGTVARVNRDGMFDVDYEDGDKRQSALAANIRLPKEAKVRPKKYDGRSCGGRGGGDHARSRDDDCDDRCSDSRARGSGGQDAKPKVRQLTEVVYTATGPKAVSFDAPPLPPGRVAAASFCWTGGGTGARGRGVFPSHARRGEWLRCSVEVEVSPS